MYVAKKEGTRTSISKKFLLASKSWCNVDTCEQLVWGLCVFGLFLFPGNRLAEAVHWTEGKSNGCFSRELKLKKICKVLKIFLSKIGGLASSC